MPGFNPPPPATTQAQCHFVYNIPHTDCLGVKKMGLLSEKLATSRVRYGKAKPPINN
jgi:hypothetical protein